jgi:hypothetical protein
MRRASFVMEMITANLVGHLQLETEVIIII